MLRLAELVQEYGGTIFEQTMLYGPVEIHPVSLRTSAGEIRFDQVICAVHSNFTYSYRLYFQTPAYQSYVIAARIRSDLPDALFWDDSHPYFYVRRAALDGRTILVGGRDHRTGNGNESVAMQELENWIQQRFDVEEIVSRWSAELFDVKSVPSSRIWVEFFAGIRRNRRGTARFMADALRPTASVSTDRLRSILAKPDNEDRDSRTLMEWVAGAGLSGAKDAPGVSGFRHSAPATNFIADEALVSYSN